MGRKALVILKIHRSAKSCQATPIICTLDRYKTFLQGLVNMPAKVGKRIYKRTFIISGIRQLTANCIYTGTGLSQKNGSAKAPKPFTWHQLQCRGEFVHFEMAC